MNPAETALRPAFLEPRKRQFAFQLLDGTWVTNWTTETDTVRIYEQVVSDGFRPVELIVFKPEDFERGRWAELKKRYTAEEFLAL